MLIASSPFCCEYDGASPAASAPSPPSAPPTTRSTGADGYALGRRGGRPRRDGPVLPPVVGAKGEGARGSVSPSPSSVAACPLRKSDSTSRENQTYCACRGAHATGVTTRRRLGDALRLP